MRLRRAVVHTLASIAAIGLIVHAVIGSPDLVLNAQARGGAAVRSASLRRSDVFPLLKEHRFKPFPAAQLTPEMRELVGQGNGPFGNGQVSLCLYQRTGLCRGYHTMTFGGSEGHGITTKYNTIPVRDHDLLVLRTAWLNRCHTIWSNHINVVAPRAGLADAESLRRITVGSDAPGWSDWDRTMLRAAEDMHQYRMITDPTWKALDAKYTEGQLFEVLITLGHYNTVNMWFNTMGMQPDKPIYHPFPADPGDSARVNQPVQRVDPYPHLASSGKGPRFPPLRRAQMNARQLDILKWATRDPKDAEGNIQVRFCLYNPELCRSYWYFTDRARVRYATMPVRDHELAILRTAWLTRGETIWSNHLNAVAPIANLNDEASIAGIVRGPDAPIWTPWEKTILKATDELHMNRFISEPTWTALDAAYDEGQLAEFILLVGQYTNVIGYFESVGNGPNKPVHRMPADPAEGKR